MAGRAVRAAVIDGRDQAIDDPLAPYVPRLVVDWLHDEPHRPYRSVTGTCVFADISGFTALTERLSASGKVGAEEMADVLNSTFDQLLTAAYDFGASLIKWGGDAVLLLFDGPGHVERAANGARSMQAVMRRIGKLQTSRGVVRLGMSIGVHTGDLDLMLVGAVHRELIVTGPVATTTALMEKVASRGEIVVSAATAAALPARCIGAAVGDGFLLTGAPDITATPNRAVKRRGVDLRTAMCADLSAHLRGGASEHEHRFVAVAFLKFSGTDRLLAEHGPDALTDAIRYLVDAVEQAAADNSVTFLASDLAEDGGKFMLAAGAPHSAGDDVTRLLATMRRVVHTGGRLELTAGVTCGSVFAGDFGPFYRRTYSLAGDMVNLAARLASYARPGQVITTPEAVARSRTVFDVVELPPFAVKGKAQPIHAVVIGDPRRGAEHTTAERLPLVGRDAELDVLLSAAQSASAGHGCVVDIVGPAGIGKSRLIEELTTRAGLQVLWTDGDIYGRTTPYQPMHRMLRSTLGLPPDVDQQTMQGVLQDLVAGTAPDLAPLLPLIGTAAGVDLPSTPDVERLDPEVRRARLEAVTSDLLGRLLPGPIVMVLNDVHFMDDPTIGLVRQLADDVLQRAWLIIVTRRSLDETVLKPGAHITTLELAPLDAAASAQLVAAATDAMPLPEHRVRRLAERAGGNPLFLTHLVAGASDTNVDALPDTIEGVVAAQIDRLPARRRRWLRAASVLGMTVDPELLTAVLADSDLAQESWAGLDEFITMNVNSQLEFTHHLVRHSAYEGLPYRRRVDLHARTAHLLERRLGADADEHAALLSLHCLEGAQYTSAWRYSRVAGDRARDQYAPAEAVACYRRALSAAARVGDVPADDVTDVLERLAETLMDIGEMDEAERALRQARQRAKHDALRSARLCLATAHHRQHLGRHADALRWITRGRSLLGAETTVEARKLRVTLGWRAGYIRYDQGAYKAGLVWARRALDEARAAHDDAAEATALAMTSVLEAAAGIYVDESRMRYVMEVYDRVDDHRGKVRAANLFGICLYFAGKWDAAVRYYAEAEQTFRSIGRDHDAAMVATNRAEVLVQQGRIEEAEALVSSAVRVLLGARATSYLGFAITIYGRVALAKGDYDAAIDRLAEARSMCLEMGEMDEALTVDSLVAECLLRAGNAVDALSYAEVALSQMSEVRGEVTAEPALHRVHGEALLVGGWPGGEASLRTSLETARRRGARNETYASLDALLRHGIAEDEDEARAWRAELADLSVQLGIVTPHADRVLFPSAAAPVLTERSSGPPPAQTPRT